MAIGCTTLISRVFRHQRVISPCDVQVRQLRHRLLQFRHDNSVVMVTKTGRHDNSDSASTQDRKAFVTTVILLATLTFFFLPHTIYFFVSLNTDTSHESMSSVTSLLLVLYMTLLPYLKMISDPLVYGVRICRRPPAGAPITSRAIYVDAASTVAVLRAGPTTSPATSVVRTRAGTCHRCCPSWAALLCVHCQRGSVNNADTYTAVVTSVPHSAANCRRGRSSVYNTFRLQTIPPSPVAEDNTEEML